MGGYRFKSHWCPFGRPSAAVTTAGGGGYAEMSPKVLGQGRALRLDRRTEIKRKNMLEKQIKILHCQAQPLLCVLLFELLLI